MCVWGGHCHPRRCPRVPEARDVDPPPHCATTHSAQPSCLTATRWTVGAPRCPRQRSTPWGQGGQPWPPCCEPADALQRQRARGRQGAFARPGNHCVASPTLYTVSGAPGQPNEAAVHPWPNEKLGQRTQSTECLVARLGHEPERNQASAPQRCPNPAANSCHTPTDAGTWFVDSREGTHN